MQHIPPPITPRPLGAQPAPKQAAAGPYPADPHHRPAGRAKVAGAEQAIVAEQAPGADTQNQILREFLDRVVASVFLVDTTLLKMPTRGRQPVAEARQVAMYLAHVACGLSFTHVGKVFQRDRTTVSHACKRVEDKREDAQFDAALELLESTIRMIHLPDAPPPQSQASIYELADPPQAYRAPEETGECAEKTGEGV